MITAACIGFIAGVAFVMLTALVVESFSISGPKIKQASFFRRIKHYTHYKIIEYDDKYFVMIGDGNNFKFLKCAGDKLPGYGNIFRTPTISLAEEKAKLAILRQKPAYYKESKIIKSGNKNQIIMDNACK